MHALLVRDKGLAALPGRLHQKLLPVAPAAGGGDVVMIDRRFCIVGGQNLVRASVAVLAVCPRSAGPVGLGMEAMCVSLLRISVALGATNLPGRGFMDQALHILVAIHAGKQIAVDGMFHLVSIHVQADLLSVLHRSQGGVGVAGKTVFVLGLLLGASRISANKQG